MPGQIDILLGADVYDDVFLERKIQPANLPTLRETIFGWVVSGSVHESKCAAFMKSLNYAVDMDHGKIQNTAPNNDVCNYPNDFCLQKFWEIEDVASPLQDYTPEEKICDEHFQSTTYRDKCGRFVVKLPFKQEKSFTSLRNSYHIAHRRFRLLERRFARQPEFKRQYCKVIDEFIDLGHLEIAPHDLECKSDNELFYLPHHAVIKESSSTTKLRVVFDGSSKTDTGVSLNELLMVGPKVQQDLFSILLRFRFHQVAFSADLEKMYRQIVLDPGDRDYHRILWRDELSQQIKILRMTRVTFGITSSSFHVIRALKEIASANQDLKASNIISTDFYVDDLLSGTSTVREALEVQTELIKLFDRYGFQLRKWSSNCPSLIEKLPKNMCESVVDLDINGDLPVKVLGITWQPLTDDFKFGILPPPKMRIITKRIILSDTARIFDPLGWLSPKVICVKCIMQDCWLCGISWDDPIPENIYKKWIEWRADIACLTTLRLPRFVAHGDCSSFQLHGFCDASEKAYGAVIYVRTRLAGGGYAVKLLCAKTRVAPVKAISLPKLELCGAHLLARSIRAVHKSILCTSSILKKLECIRAWTDSTTVLAWLSSFPRKWKSFVANRVSEIQGIIAPEAWGHVSTDDNPADCASRGIAPNTLLTYELWWHGPRWLIDAIDSWPNYSCSLKEEVPEQRKAIVNHCVEGEGLLDMLDVERFSRLRRLIRTVAYCLRFIANVRLRRSSGQVGELSVEEVRKAEKVAVRFIQRKHFTDEFVRFSQGKPLKKSYKLLPLHPFMDADGLVRVGGRLRSSDLPYESKHPLILPKESHFTQLVIRDIHERVLHGGPQLTIGTLRQSYWILDVRNMVRRYINKCVRCIRFRASVIQQPMADLPKCRVVPSRPFHKTGLDFGGPILIRSGKGRGRKNTKAYVALFVCLATKAIHIEAVSSLSTDAFLSAFRRFVSRRGKPVLLMSDNGTNFVGGNNEISRLYRQFVSDESYKKIKDYLVCERIDWKFIPPRAPNFGGIWEAGIKSAKHHLRRIVGCSSLDFEELATLLAQIVSCLNSRPIHPMSSDPADLQALTPGHFLIGDALNVIPEPNLTDIGISRLTRWQLVQSLMQQFWKRWHNDYLGTLQGRSKWYNAANDVCIGSMVLIVEDNLPPLQWLMGRIVAVHKGANGVVRVATIRTVKGVFDRPVSKLRFLGHS